MADLLASAEPRRLADFLRENRDDILAKWELEVRSVRAASSLARPLLVDHLPELLEDLAAFVDDVFCRDVLHLPGAAGALDRGKLNVDGGAIGLGHPVGASGNRIVLHLVNAMKRLGVKRGIATECIGGGQGGAMLIEAV